MFLGNKAQDPVIVEVAQLLNVKIGILDGQINHIQNEPLGVLVVEVEGSEEIVQKAISELSKRVYKVSLLGYEQKEVVNA